MRHPTFAAASILLILCLLAALCGCSANRDPISPSDQPAAETVSAVPAPGKDRLEIDGADLGPMFELNAVPYLDARGLETLLSLTAAEPEEGVLRLSWTEGSVTLREGSQEAETAEGQKRDLSSPVLRGDGTWYLPVSALEALWGRKAIYDTEAAALRCLTLEPGPALRFDGAEAGETLLLNGTPVLAANRFAELAGGEAETVADSRGTPALCLRVGDRSLTLRAGSPRAELDGEALDLPVPVWLEGETWYLPAAAAEALGCVALEDTEAGRLDLWQVSAGPALWFDGTGLDDIRTVSGIPCAALSDLAEAAKGTLAERGDGIALTVGAHVLVFRTAEENAFADEAPLTLPIPVLPFAGELLVPVEPLAEVLELPRLEGDGLIFSRIEPRDTVLWVDGMETGSYAQAEEPLYLRLNDLFFFEENEPVIEGNEAEFTAFGKRLSLAGGSDRILADGEELPLSAPVCAAGEDWYAPAAELLTALGLSELQDPELDQVYYTRIVKNDSLAEGYRVPVLMYHAVSDKIWGIPELFISPSTLEQQLQALVEGGYTAITFEDLDRIDEIEKPVMLTFDDGYDDNYTELFPLLKQYNVKATVFVIVNDLGKNHKLTKDQVREMSESGLVSIQSHTMSHNYLDGMYEKQLRYEHFDSMLGLARITGKQPFVMCYPTGKSSGYSRTITAEYYEYGLCMGGPCWVTGDAPYRIYRYYIPRNTSLATFLSYLDG